MFLKSIILFGAFILTYHGACGQVDTVFMKSFGGDFFEDANEVILRSDGGFTVVGTTGSNETGSTDMYVASFDQELNCLWNRNYGNAGADWGLGIIEDLSGNFLVSGYTLSSVGSSYDMLVLKISAQGDVMWQQTFGGHDWDFATKIVAHPLGGYLVCGSTYSDGNGDQDGVLLHIDGQGILLNQWFLGGEGKDACIDIMTVEDGWVTAGYQSVGDLMIATLWKFNLLGNVEWVRLLDDPNGFDRSFSALSKTDNFIFGTGQVFTDTGVKSFELRMPYDNASVYVVIEEQEFEFIYLDCYGSGDRVVFVGSKIHNGIEVGRVVRKHSELYFTGVFELASQHRAKFNSVIWPNDELVMCGSFQASPTENWQAVLLRYTSPNMSEIFSDPEPVPCFSVEVHDTTLPAPGEWGVLYSTTGQIVDNQFQWDNNIHNTKLPSGMYIFRAEKKRPIPMFLD